MKKFNSFIDVLKSWFKRSKQNIPPETNISKLRQKLLSIEPNDFKYTQSSDLTLFSLQTLYSSIVEYVDVLKKVNESLEFDTTLLRINFEQELKTIRFNLFFLDRKGCYLDNDIQVVEEFIQEGSKFLSLYETCDAIRFDDPRLDHNLRVSHGILLNLFTITETLARVKYRF